tara:strand:- start:56 stop:202 length:147 start_codon:yes stop_codon:yes gene_type:complete
MGQTARITSLRGKHQNLEVKIEDEEKNRIPMTSSSTNSKNKSLGSRMS